MLMADLQPNEVCIYIKLCPDDFPKVASNNVMPIIDIDANFAAVGGDISKYSSFFVLRIFININFVQERI